MVDALLKILPSNVHLDIITTLPNRYMTYSEGASESLTELEEHPRFTVHRIPLPKHESGMLDQSKSFFVFAKEALKISSKKDYELIIATSSRLMTASLASWISFRKNTPLYLDIRDIFVDTIKDVLSPKASRLLAPVLSVIEKLTIRQASKVNLVSEGFLPYFQSRYPNQRYICFTNGIDDEFILASKSAQEKDTPHKPIHVLYAGNIGEGQGLQHIVPGLAKALSGKVRITVIGDGGRYKQLKNELDNSRCTNVELLPPMNRERLIKAYQDADVLFLHLNDYPAFEKVLPSKIFEYAALGKPILAGVAGYPASFIAKEVTNAQIFAPCDVLDGVRAFNKLHIKHTLRQDFLQKYSRVNIMNAMAADILSLLPAGTA
jgi:glycosyltransferase involved in cell wall biosynthesis